MVDPALTAAGAPTAPGRPVAMLTHSCQEADRLVRDHAGRREASVAKMAKRGRELAWEGEAERYLALVERLAGGR